MMIRSFAAILAFSAVSPIFGQVVGVGTFIHVVANLDKTIQFYGNDLGLELTGAPGPRAFAANPVVEGLYDAKDSQSRVAVLRVPGSPLGLEFVEFKGISQKPVRPNIQDPGASALMLQMSDVPSVADRLKKAGATVMGDVVQNGFVSVRDPDGFFVTLVESTAGGTRLRLTVQGMDRTLRFFREQLAFQPSPATGFATDPDRLKPFGIPTAGYRGSSANVPGTMFPVEFLEFQGVERHPMSPGIHDPGAGVLRLLVGDFDSTFGKLKAAGVPVVSAGGAPVTIGGNRRAVILRDPDGFFVQLLTAPPAAAK
jgi:catechol 2,3-dioxygenase-like lactoylglutathione lyase family enzyme